MLTHCVAVFRVCARTRTDYSEPNGFSTLVHLFRSVICASGKLINNAARIIIDQDESLRMRRYKTNAAYR